MARQPPITSADDPALAELCGQLEALAETLQGPSAWPARQLHACAESGVFSWFHDRADGGQGWSDAEIVRGYLRLAAACLTTTFVITQRQAAALRVAASTNSWVRQRLLPDLVAGRSFATVGISHLTTSRRHLAAPVLRATPCGEAWLLEGFSPWVTGGQAAETIVTGAIAADGQQLLIAVPTTLPGVRAEPPLPLLGLSASGTGPVHFEGVTVPSQWVVAGPAADVLRSGTGTGTGGIQTSTLALGLTDAIVGYLESEARPRPELAEPARALRAQWQALRAELLDIAAGVPRCSTEQLRSRANSVVLRASQAALAAAKGAGYVEGHRVERWCREALFFLVWSCPQPVLAANLCEWAGIQE